MGHGGASARPLGRSRSTGFIPILSRSSSLRSLRGSMMSAQAASGNAGSSRRSLMAFVGVLMGVLVAGAVLLSLHKREVEYAVVMDSGSTGTRCYVYSWARSGASGLPQVVDRTAKLGRAERFGQRRAAYKRVETEPGLDQFVGDAVKLNQALDPLIQYALKEVPASKQPATPVFLFATAGLRRLPSADSAWILQTAQHTLSASPFLFEPEWARIISGQDEAVYGWIALNYLLGKLNQGEETTPLGSLDLGGSSLEVTFLPEKVPPPGHGTNVTIKETDYHLYAHSHSSFGMNDAFQRSVLLAMDDQAAGKDAIEVEHPCLHDGYNDTYRFKNHGSQATVSTSAVADKALQANQGRRLLRWARKKLPFRSEGPARSRPSVQQSRAASFQSVLDRSVKAGLGVSTATFDTALEQPLGGPLTKSPRTRFFWWEVVVRLAFKVGKVWSREPSLSSTLHAEASASPPQGSLSRAQHSESRTFQKNRRPGVSNPKNALRSLVEETEYSPSGQPLSPQRPQFITARRTLEGEPPYHSIIRGPVRRLQDEVDSTDSTEQQDVHVGEGSKFSGKESMFLGEESNGAALAVGRSLAEGSLLPSVKLVGRPDWEACQALVDRVVTSAGECSEQPCALGAHQPALRGQFVALTGFFVVHHFFGLAGSAPLDQLLDVGQAFCKKAWTDVESEYYGERGLDRYCFRAPYVVSLLRKGLGLRDDQIRIGTGDMAWTLGAALYEGGALKPAPKPVALEQSGALTIAQLLQVPRSRLPQTLSGLVAVHLPLLIVILALVGLTAVTVVRWWNVRVRSFDARARRAYLPLHNSGGRPGGPDGGKPGHAFSRRLIDRQRAALLEPIPASPPSIPVKAPLQTGLAARRTTSTDAAGLELQRSIGGELGPDEDEYSP